MSDNDSIPEPTHLGEPVELWSEGKEVNRWAGFRDRITPPKRKVDWSRWMDAYLNHPATRP